MFSPFGSGGFVGISEQQTRRSFSVWLRTGRWPKDADGVELKFNAWHDPETGRFTFTGMGHYFAQGSGKRGFEQGSSVSVAYIGDPKRRPIASLEEADAWKAAELAKYGHVPARRKAIEARYRVYRDALTPRRADQNSQIVRGGGSFGGGGASGSWDNQPAPTHLRRVAALLSLYQRGLSPGRKCKEQGSLSHNRIQGVGGAFCVTATFTRLTAMAEQDACREIFRSRPIKAVRERHSAPQGGLTGVRAIMAATISRVASMARPMRSIILRRTPNSIAAIIVGLKSNGPGRSGSAKAFV